MSIFVINIWWNERYIYFEYVELIEFDKILIILIRYVGLIWIKNTNEFGKYILMKNIFGYYYSYCDLCNVII